MNGKWNGTSEIEAKETGATNLILAGGGASNFAQDQVANQSHLEA